MLFCRLLDMILINQRMLTTSWQALRSKPSSATEVDTSALRQPALNRSSVAFWVCNQQTRGMNTGLAFVFSETRQRIGVLRRPAPKRSSIAFCNCDYGDDRIEVSLRKDAGAERRVNHVEAACLVAIKRRELLLPNNRTFATTKCSLTPQHQNGSGQTQRLAADCKPMWPPISSRGCCHP